jgi:membrane protein DedA with SNARE-associated domain
MLEQFQQWLTQLDATAPLMPYLLVIGVFFLTGFGLPFPEDIPIIAAAWMAAAGYAEAWLMFPVVFGSIVGSDAIVFFLGRRYGHHVPRMPLLRRYLSEKRLGKTEAMLHAHGGKFMFAARFLPGIRTPAIFTAGSFKVPYWRFLLYDGAAAAVSVPVIFFLTYFLVQQVSVERIRHWVEHGQITAGIVVGAVAALLITIKLLIRRRANRAMTSAHAPAEPGPPASGHQPNPEASPDAAPSPDETRQATPHANKQPPTANHQ